MAVPPRSGSTRIAMLSTYPPTQCGLATFNAALWRELGGPAGSADVVRVVDRPEAHPAPEVVGHLVNGSADSARAAVRLLDRYDAVVVQHEYGIYGGPDGVDVLAVLEALSVPMIVVLHTVLTHPTAGQRQVLLRLLAVADVVVTMTETARGRLLEGYGAVPEHVVVIPHGAVDNAQALGVPRLRQRPLVLTWGLLGPGKGIEWAVDALPALRDLDPRYLVVGRTHPRVFERDGDAYRDGLRARAERLGVADLLELDDSYLSVPDLGRLVAQADVVLLPYDSVDQVTSGVLTEAVAAGRPVVSTGFPHARELLPGGPGLLVPQGDAPAIAAAVRRVLTEPGLAATMAEASARQAPELYWGAVAGRYRALADDLATAALAEVS